MNLRERLIAARPDAKKYAETLRAIPEEIRWIRANISHLALYPIKSLGGLPVDTAAIAEDGLWTPDEKLGDRMAMLAIRDVGEAEGQIHEYSRFSPRNEGKLVLAKPEYNGETLSYEAPDFEEKLVIPVQDLQPKDGRPVALKMFGDSGIMAGVLEKGPITDWVRRYLRKVNPKPKYRIDDVEVILPPQNFSRYVEQIHRRNLPAKTLYTDGGQLLVTSTSTLDWMNKIMEECYGTDYRRIAMEAFRPNMVIDDLLPNMEDIIDNAFIDAKGGKVKMFFGDMSVRCDVTRVDQSTGEKPKDAEPLKWLAKNRPPRLDKPNSTTFGINTVFNPLQKEEGKAMANRVLTKGDLFFGSTEKV